MSRLSRINTIWRKELSDTLRDRRTLIAMILVPLVLYPGMMLVSLQGFELQVSRLKQEEYRIGVLSDEARARLRHLLDTDPSRQPGATSLPAEALVEKAEQREFEHATDANAPARRETSASETARADVRRQPPPYEIVIVPDEETLKQDVASGLVHIGLTASAWPTRGYEIADGEDLTPAPPAEFTLIVDQTDIRSQIAAAGLEGVLDRVGERVLADRLSAARLPRAFITPLAIKQESVATPEKVGGSILGQIVPLILVVMTLMGAVYPAIDLTAGERERGTLETLMVAPVPTVDLIAGKFVVVALIAMLSALLNLLSIGGTIYLGGLGSLLTQGGQVVIPLTALPWVLLVLIPLAVVFSAALLAVCSFARSFKEAQNYVMPVMIAALIPAVIGVLPGMRLDGPLLIMPVTNIVILTRDLFTGRTDLIAFAWVMLSTTLYAGAAVAVAAKLFGQEAVLFADSGSIKTLFQRRFFKPADRPTTAQAFLLLALAFSANHFAQSTLLGADVFGTARFWPRLAAIMATVFVAAPVFMALYLRVRLRPAFGLVRPDARGMLAALLFGSSTWVLAQAWLAFQKTWLSLPPEVERMFQTMTAGLADASPVVLVVFLALIPALCEELFFRGYALNGLRGGLGRTLAVVLTAAAFGLFHGSVHRLIPTTLLGLVFGLLVIRHGAIWPAMLAHFMHNGLSVLSTRSDGLLPFCERLGYDIANTDGPPVVWVVAAGLLTLVGLALCAPGLRTQRDPVGGDAPATDLPAPDQRGAAAGVAAPRASELHEQAR